MDDEDYVLAANGITRSPAPLSSAVEREMVAMLDALYDRYKVTTSDRVTIGRLERALA